MQSQAASPINTRRVASSFSQWMKRWRATSLQPVMLARRRCDSRAALLQTFFASPYRSLAYIEKMDRGSISCGLTISFWSRTTPVARDELPNLGFFGAFEPAITVHEAPTPASSDPGETRDGHQPD